MRSLLKSMASVVVFAGVAQPAEAYVYRGPIAETWACPPRSASCEVVADGSFIGIRVRDVLPADMPEHPLVRFMPVNPNASGGVRLTAMTFLVRVESGQARLTVRRSYTPADGGQGGYDIDYPVTDPLVIDVDAQAALDVTFYVSANQAWIESRQRSTNLARVRTLPLFFGWRGTEAGRVVVDVNPVSPGLRRVQGVRVRTKDLLDDVRINYAQRRQDTPFLFQGDRRRAAALAAQAAAGGAR